MKRDTPSSWDHLIQDYDSGKSNFGVVSNHVELINANAGNLQQFWNHFNGIDYNPQFDQILISSRNQCEVWIIDHSTTTAQAAGHTGGRCGKGGDLLYRWGFPEGNNLADSSHKQMLWQQHCATWIPSNFPGAGHILIHDNGVGRGYTSIDEIVPPVDSNGSIPVPAMSILDRRITTGSTPTILRLTSTAPTSVAPNVSLTVIPS